MSLVMVAGHVVADKRAAAFRCRCGHTLTLRLPVTLKVWLLYLRAFEAEHENCGQPGARPA